MTPLLAAMTFASRDVVEKLMDIGGPALVEKDGLALLGERPCLFRGAIVSGRCDNIKLLLERYPQYASASIRVRHFSVTYGDQYDRVLKMACGSIPSTTARCGLGDEIQRQEGTARVSQIKDGNSALVSQR